MYPEFGNNSCPTSHVYWIWKELLSLILRSDSVHEFGVLILMLIEEKQSQKKEVVHRKGLG